MGEPYLLIYIQFCAEVVLVSSLQNNTFILFQDNIARYAGDSIYFHIPGSCSSIVNISEYKSICQFNFTQSSLPSYLPCANDFT